jgi:hypothetical protein
MSANRKTRTLDRLAYRLRLAIRSSVRRNHTIINQLYFISKSVCFQIHSNEPDDIESPSSYKILMKKVIFQHKIATDPIGKRSPELGGINMLYLE